MMILYEDIMDDIDMSEITPDSHDIENLDLSRDFSFMISGTITSIDVKYRENLQIFIDKLKEFDKFMKYCMDSCRFVSDFDEKICYSILDSILNDTKDNYSPQWINTYYGSYKSEEFEYQGLTFFNDPNLLEQPELTKEFINFTFRVSFNFRNNPRNDIMLYMFFKMMVNNVCKRVYSAYKPAALSYATVKNIETGTSIRLTKENINDIYNKNNSSTVMNKVYKLHRLIYRNKNYEKVDDYFNSGQYTSETLETLKKCGLTPEEVYIDEDDKYIRIELRDKKPTIIAYANKFYEMIEKLSKKLFIIMNGTLRLFVYTGTEQYKIDTVIDAFSMNMNKVFLTVGYTSPTFGIHVNLRSKLINDLTIVYESPRIYDTQRGMTEKIQVYLNQCDKPKALKYVDMEEEEKKKEEKRKAAEAKKKNKTGNV